MKKKTILKVIAIILILVIGSSSLSSASSTISSSNHGHEVINRIKARNSATGGTTNTVESLKNRAKNKNTTTQTVPNTNKQNTTNKTNKQNKTIMIASDARYFNIYESTDEDSKIVGRLIAYNEVKILKTVGKYYKIKEGYINKKSVLTQQEFDKYSKRKGTLNFDVTKHSNASLDDIKRMTANYPNAKGLELTFLICEEEYDINAIVMISCAILESQMGDSKIGRKKNNWFGIQAYDWDPFNCAKKFDTPAECIDYWCNMIKTRYIAEGRTTLKTIGKKYCSSSSWATKIESICRRCITQANDT
jgi:beta-N-acetylglucosaminidase